MKIIQTLLSLIFILSTTQGIAQVKEQANVENDSLAIDALTILPNGNVGIGTNKPTQKLEVYGTINATGDINTQGSVLIGGSTAQKPLDISKKGGIRINRTENASRDNEILFADNGQIRSLDDNHRIIFDREKNRMEMREFGNIVFSPGAENGIRTEKVTFKANGNVGIGTDDPIQAKLVVSGFGNELNLGGFNYLTKSRKGISNPGMASGSHGYSIYASSRIAAMEFNAFSDARIKTIFGVSNAAKDLEILSKIEITDYTLIDTIAKGNQTHKKVIAQQVKEVYPQAVSSNLTGVIPNIYALSAIKGGWIQTNTKDLVVGDKIQLIFSEDETLVDVLEIQGDALKVASDQEGPVFVYGKQVSDFHTVDYEAIAMLNVSATQELLKRIETLSRKQKQLEDHLSASVSRIEKLEILFNNLK